MLAQRNSSLGIRLNQITHLQTWWARLQIFKPHILCAFVHSRLYAMKKKASFDNLTAWWKGNASAATEWWLKWNRASSSFWNKTKIDMNSLANNMLRLFLVHTMYVYVVWTMSNYKTYNSTSWLMMQSSIDGLLTNQSIHTFPENSSCPCVSF